MSKPTFSDDWKAVHTSKDGRVRRAARRLCRQLGIPTSDKPFRPPPFEPSFGWSGKALHFDPNTVSDSDLMHEIAHWLIAEDRSGPNLETTFRPDEEEVASLMGILLIAPHNRTMASWISESHNWGDFDTVVDKFEGMLKRDRKHRDVWLHPETDRRLRQVLKELEAIGISILPASQEIA